MATRVAFTLPISCQICLGKVKDPVVCSNQHVFCKECIDLWLERNPQCPACRIPISAENPYRPVLGGLNPNSGVNNEHVSSRELRRSRMELLYKDYESEIEHLQVEIDQQKKEIAALRQQVGVVNESNLTRSLSEPNAPTNHDDVPSSLVLLQNRLKETTSLYKGAKSDLDRQKKECVKLKDEVVALERENEKLKLDLINRSPRRFGRYTVGALESMVQSSDKEIQQLNRALEKSDAHIADLEEQLTLYRKNDHSSSAALHGHTFVRRNGYENTQSMTDIGSSRNTSASSNDELLSTINSTLSHVGFQVAADSNALDSRKRTNIHESFLLDVPSEDCSRSEVTQEYSFSKNSFLKPDSIEKARVNSVISAPLNSAFNFECPSRLSNKTASTDTQNSVGNERTTISTSVRSNFSLSSPDGNGCVSRVSSDAVQSGSSCKKKLRFMLPDEESHNGKRERKSPTTKTTKDHRSCTTTGVNLVTFATNIARSVESIATTSNASDISSKISLGFVSLKPGSSSERVDGRLDVNADESIGIDMNVSLTPEVRDCLRLMDEAEVKVKERKRNLFVNHPS